MLMLTFSAREQVHLGPGCASAPYSHACMPAQAHGIPYYHQLPHPEHCVALGGGVFSRYTLCCVHFMALTAVTPG
jgi:hypothetical protein